MGVIMTYLPDVVFLHLFFTVRTVIKKKNMSHDHGHISCSASYLLYSSVFSSSLQYSAKTMSASSVLTEDPSSVVLAEVTGEASH